jgi:hypothetical protein
MESGEGGGVWVDSSFSSHDFEPMSCVIARATLAKIFFDFAAAAAAD